MVLQRLGIKTGGDSQGSTNSPSNNDQLNDDRDSNNDDGSQSGSSDEQLPNIRHSFSKRDRNYSDRLADEKSHWFVNFDASFVRPIFSR